MDAKETLDRLYKARMDAMLGSMLTELTDQPDQFSEIIARYHSLAANHMKARATVAAFIQTIFKDAPT